MAALAEVLSERRKHRRNPGRTLVAEIRGSFFEVLDISFGGMKVSGQCAFAGALIDVTVVPAVGGKILPEEKVVMRGRVTRVESDFSAVQFSNVTAALGKLVAG